VQQSLLDVYHTEFAGLLVFFRSRSNPEDAKDLLQELGKELCNCSPKEPIREPRGYVYQIAWHLVKRYRRRQVKTRLGLLQMQQSAAGTNDQWNSTDVEQLATQEQLERIADKLPLEQREVLALWLEGFIYTEIAERLGLTGEAVKQHFKWVLLHFRCEFNRLSSNRTLQKRMQS